MQYIFLVFTFFTVFNLSLLWCSSANQERLAKKTEQQISSALKTLSIEQETPEKTTLSQATIEKSESFKDSIIGPNHSYAEGL